MCLAPNKPVLDTACHTWSLQPEQEGEIVEATVQLKRAATDFDMAMQPVKKLKPAKSWREMIQQDVAVPVMLVHM